MSSLVVRAPVSLRALFSALWAGVLSFASPKESSQRRGVSLPKAKGDPQVGAGLRPVPCATRQAGRLAKLACGSNTASRRPPARLRCSAPLRGTRKASRDQAPSKKLNAAVDRKKCPKMKPPLESGWFAGPLERCRATQGLAEKGRGLSEGRSPEFRSPRQSRVAQGTGAAGTDPGSPSFCLLFLGEARKSETPRKGGTQRPIKPPSQFNPTR